ncbi:MAG: PEP-CTERM sorting domain-containing protein [Thiobacillus sp.]|nr:PEP-CTERM sorting domain-containing protein [Thiobacillus sp.]
MLAGFASSPALASPASIQPLIAGSFAAGDGVNSQWVQVAADWRGTIHGSQSWGTGLWGLADAEAALSLPSGAPGVVQVYSGVLGNIQWADQRYLDTWAPTWGAQSLVPFFHPDPDEYQDNYAVRFTGYVAVPTSGFYNFGVLYDDGFRFSLSGQGATLSLLQDGLNPRDRLGFDNDLLLDAGLYGFELVAWERLESGVVQLAWTQDGGAWATVPQTYLYTTPVPEPATALNLLAGLGALAAFRRFARRRV